MKVTPWIVMNSWHKVIAFIILFSFNALKYFDLKYLSPPNLSIKLTVLLSFTVLIYFCSTAIGEAFDRYIVKGK